jgi:LysM repeat protein
MKILSIDVGIKNLAFCLFEKTNDSQHFKIKKWNVVNICEPEVYNCSFLEKSVVCNKPAKFRKDNQCFCLKHSKKQEFQFPTSECKPAFIMKQKNQKLYEIADKYGIQYEKPIKKNDLVTAINEYIQNNFFKPVETKNASKTDLIDIGINLKNKFNETFSDEEFIDYVIIENQISPIANRMKTIQGMIVQYFIMSDVLVDNFEFISAANKLKDFLKEEKIKYSDRKKLGIVKTLETITNDHRFHEHVEYFKNHKKKDDLADSFLQGLWFINNRSFK